MFGFSVYLNGPMSDDKGQYIKMMKGAGFKGVFTSLQIPEEDSSEYIKYLRQLGSFCKKEQLTLTIDVSSKSLNRLDISLEESATLKDWGVTCIRADTGITFKEIAVASKKINIALNASTLSRKDLIELKKDNADFEHIEAWNNYYPHPNTGISKSFYMQRIEELHEFNIKVFSFVPGDSNLRQPLYEGLPTLEDHRELSPFVGAMELLDMGTDGIYIGDEGLSKMVRNQFELYESKKILLLYLDSFDSRYSQWILREHYNRQDNARDVFRSVESRSWKINNLVPRNCVDRPIGTVTIDNKLYGRYSGEIELTKINLPSDEKTNVIAHVCQQDIPLVRFLNERCHVTLKSIKESE